MAFQQGLSGLNSASRNLDVIGHNIANANTVGMKSSRAEFAELYASSVNAAGGSNKGIGVTVATVSQLFTQGNITVTGNDLDLAINGNGFFNVTQTNGDVAYTRSGAFKLDKEGFLVTNAGAQVDALQIEVRDGANQVVCTTNVNLVTGQWQCGAEVESLGSWPAIACSSRAESSTVRANGPGWSSELAKATTPQREQRP